jgi:hypothetical protein
LIVDDTKRAQSWGNKSAVPGVIFEVCNGAGRQRGSPTGTAQTQHWRTVFLTSGEQRCTDFDASGGTATRMLSIWGSIFGPATAEIADMLAEAKAGWRRHYGHAGPAWVQWLLEHRLEGEDRWAEQLTDRRTEIRHLIASAEAAPADLSVQDRIAGYLAVLDLVEELAHEALRIPWDRTHAARSAIERAAAGARVADREAEALSLLASHLASHPAAIQALDTQDEPYGGWIGWIDSASESRPWTIVGVYPSVLKRLLVTWGFEPNAILRRWQEDKVTYCNQGRVDRLLTICGGKRVKMIAFRRSPLEAAGFAADASIDSEQIPF